MGQNGAPRMGGADWATLGPLSVLWGGSFLFVGVAVRELPTLTIVALRVGLAALALWALVALTGRRAPRTPAAWGALAVMGLLNNAVPFTLIAWGQQAIPSGLASILNATTPLWGVAVAALLLPDERPGRGKLAGVVAGFAGVAAMAGLDALGSLGTHVPAQLAVLGAALSYAVASAWGRRLGPLGLDPVAAAAGQVTAAAALLAPLALAVDRPWALPPPSGAAWAAVAALALLSTAVAYVLYFRLLARAGATNILLVTFLVPVSAIGLGAAVLGERLGAGHLVGMALVGLGLAAIDGRPLAWARDALR